MRFIDLLVAICSLASLIDAKLEQSERLESAKLRLMQASVGPNASVAHLPTANDVKTSSSVAPSTVISSHPTSAIPETSNVPSFVSTDRHSSSITTTKLTTLVVSSSSSVNVPTTWRPTVSSNTIGSTQSKPPKTTSIIVATTASVSPSSADSSSVTATNTPSIPITQSVISSTEIFTTTLISTTTTLLPSTLSDTTTTESTSTTAELFTTEEILGTTTEPGVEIDDDAFHFVNGKMRCGSINFIQLLVLLLIMPSTCETVSKMSSISTDVLSSTYAPGSIQTTAVNFAARAAEITTGIAFVLIIIAITIVIVAISLEEKYRWEYQAVKRRQIRPRLTLEHLRALQQAAQNG
ncbi:hypothetical protein M3Y98_01222300 [Aphelenchoides besseyi]|nr:hypothetical protein M3Y98_01222300 [Aphelenchoides besseyi]